MLHIYTKLKLKTNYQKAIETNETVNLKTKRHLQNLKKLSNDKNIYYSKFDKGNGICLTDKEVYKSKTKTLLADRKRFKLFTPDKRVKKNNFIYFEEKFNKTLKEMYDKGQIDEAIYKKALSKGSQPARLYGLPKVHKDEKNPPFCPILSIPNAYCTNLAKWLDDILKPHIPSEMISNDTFDFVNKFHAASLPINSFLVSYDVKSLFTNVPVDETIKHICEIIPNDCLPIDKVTFSKLLKLACTNVLFSFDNELYLQVDGMSMGSNLGPTMAAFCMNMIERKMSQQYLFYTRYVDDVLAVFKTKHDAETFLKDINKIHCDIQFTTEFEENNTINFLDVTIERTSRTFNTKWHLKKTNTCTYINKMANSPNNYKHSAIRSLITRAYRICSTVEDFQKAFQTITYIFTLNGFHFKLLEKIKDQIISKEMEGKEHRVEKNKLFMKRVYSKKTEKENKNMVKEVNKLLPNHTLLQIAYQTKSTQTFFTNKDKVTNGVKSSLVYFYKCDQCPGHCYVGETKRHFDTRQQEHIKGMPTPTEVSLHQHPPKQTNFKIAITTNKPKIGEALIYNTIPENLRLNNYRPPFQLKLFDFQTNNTQH